MSELAQRDGPTGGRGRFDSSTHKGTDAQQASDPDLISSLRLYEPPPLSRRRQKAPAVGNDSIQGADQTEELRDACVALARRARDAFKDACSSENPDEAEASFASAKGLIEDLWEYAYLRDRPFRDLLALVDAALKRAELTELNETQRAVLIQAFHDLPRWMLEDTTVEGHIDRFAEHEVDIMGPLRITKGKRVRVTFEEIED